MDMGLGLAHSQDARGLPLLFGFVHSTVQDSVSLALMG